VKEESGHGNRKESIEARAGERECDTAVCRLWMFGVIADNKIQSYNKSAKQH